LVLNKTFLVAGKSPFTAVTYDGEYFILIHKIRVDSGLTLHDLLKVDAEGVSRPKNLSYSYLRWPAFTILSLKSAVPSTDKVILTYYGEVFGTLYTNSLPFRC